MHSTSSHNAESAPIFVGAVEVGSAGFAMPSFQPVECALLFSQLLRTRLQYAFIFSNSMHDSRFFVNIVKSDLFENYAKISFLYRFTA